MGALWPHAAVAKRIGRLGGEERHRSFFAEMEVADARYRLRANQGHIAGEHQNILVALHLLARAHNGVAGAALLLLKNEIYAGECHRLLRPLSFVANDGVDPVGGNNLPGGFNHMLKQWLACNDVQNFRMLGLEPRALAGGHDGNGEVVEPRSGTLT